MRYDENTVMKALREADDDVQHAESDSVFDSADPLADASPKVTALSELLDIDPISIEEPGDSEYFIHGGEHADETYKVLTLDERDELLHDSLQNLLSDVGFQGVGLDIRQYVDDDYCTDTMEEYIDDDVSDMSDEDIIDWLLENDCVELKDDSWFRLKDGIDADDLDFDAYDVDNYECIRSRWELEQACASAKKEDDLVEMFWEYGFGDGIDEDVLYHARHNYGAFPSYIDVDKAVDDLVDECDPGQELALYDGVELLKAVDGVDYYIYRID